MHLLTPEGYRLHADCWLPAGEIRAVVVLAHGLNEHSGRYAHVIQHLNRHGYAVYALDHCGHGQSEGERGYFDTVAQPIEHLKLFIDFVRGKHPDSLLFLYGHSMGALISLVFVCAYEDDLDGLILSGVPLGVERRTPRFLIRLNALLDRRFSRLRFIPFPPIGISHDPDVVARLRADKLCNHGLLRIRIAQFILEQCAAARAQLAGLRLPLLLLHGGGDFICPVSGSQFIYEQAASPDKTLKIYPKLYHEIHNEPQQGEVLDDVAAWLAAHS